MQEENLSFISEMVNNEEVNVEFAKGVDAKSIAETAKDTEPMFVTLEALNEGESRNGRYYPKETIYQIAEQINKMKPVGYNGHLDPKDRSYKRPKAVTIWLGAKVIEDLGKARLFIKGYVYPSASDLREFLKVAKAVGKNVAVSIYGQAREIMDKVKKVKNVLDMDLESIDWARDLTEGVRTKGFLAITAEMKNDNDKISILEMYDNLKNQMREQVKQEVEQNLVAEMVELKKTVCEQLIDTELKNRIGNANARNVIKKIVVAEIANGGYNKDIVSEIVNSILSTENAKTIIKETKSSYDINPFIIDNSSNLDKRKFTTVK